jgi:sensor histidine kinase YesM
MKKYGYRLVISVLVYFFFRVNSEQHWGDMFIWNAHASWYLFYTIIVIMITWEAVARSVGYWKTKDSLTSTRGLYLISLKATLIMLPLVFLFSYIFTYKVKPMCDCEGLTTKDSFTQLWVVSSQGFVIGLLVQAYEIIKAYIKTAIQNAREKELIQKELISAKFEGLKKQVNPHFLFNSFSVLTSLVESGSPMASKFIEKLSDMYRYILESESKQVVLLKEEIRFLDDYVFLMKMRHQEGIIVKNEISLDETKITVPPMSLQVLVENAIKHNSFSKAEPLTISIKNQGEDFIVVENPRKPKNEIVRSTGIGLENLSKRLGLIMKQGLEIVESPEHFKVKLPLSNS